VNRPIPKLGSIKTPSEISEKFVTGFTHFALPAIASKTEDQAEISIDLPQRTIKNLEKIFGISFPEEVRKNSSAPTIKAGDVIEIPIFSRSPDSVLKILLVGVGEKSDVEIRKAGTALGRKVRGTKSYVLSLI